MNPLGGMIGGGLTGLVGGLFGSIGSAIAAKKAKKAQLKANKEMGDINEEMFNRNYYQDIMARSDTQAALQAQRDLMKESLKQQQRTAAITGATPESIVAAQQGMNNSLSNTISGIQANASAIKDNAYNNYMAQKGNLAEQKGKIEANAQMAKGQAWSNFGNMLANGGMQIGNAFAQQYAKGGNNEKKE